MTAHTYNQYCPIAHALDLIGDRWALLIVRDLYLGPKRFTDLKGGLPGLGTNILAARLKTLEQSGVVTRRALPFPAAATVYELTPDGRTLGTTLGDLARWGSRTLGPPQPGQALSPDSIMLTVSGLFQGYARALPRGTYAVQITAPSLHVSCGVSIADGTAQVSRETPEQPDITLQTDIATVVSMVAQRLSLREAVERGAARMEGDPTLVADVLASVSGVRA